MCSGLSPFKNAKIALFLSRFSLTIRRRAGFEAYLLIIPAIILGLMTLLVFTLPAEGSDRHSLGKLKSWRSGIEHHYSKKVNLHRSLFIIADPLVNMQTSCKVIYFYIVWYNIFLHNIYFSSYKSTWMLHVLAANPSEHSSTICCIHTKTG